MDGQKRKTWQVTDCLLPAVDAEKENIDDKGKKPMESPGEAVGEDTDDEEGADGDEEDKGEEAETDMHLAWQMLEIARTIYQQDVDKYAGELAGEFPGLLSVLFRAPRVISCITSDGYKLTNMQASSSNKFVQKSALRYTGRHFRGNFPGFCFIPCGGGKLAQWGRLCV